MSQPFGFTTTVKAGQIPSVQSYFTWVVTTENFSEFALDGRNTVIDTISNNSGELLGGATYDDTGIVFGGVDGNIEFDSSITLSGDFTITFDTVYTTTVRIYLGNLDALDTFIACLSSERIRVAYDGNFYDFTGFLINDLDNISVEVERVGTDLNVTVNGETKSIASVSTADITYFTFGGGTTYPIIGKSTYLTFSSGNNYDLTKVAPSFLNGGGDLRCYTDNTKTTQLPIELVSFVTGSTPEIVVWGLSPLLGVGDTVYFEKDLTEISQPPVADTYGRNSVWVDYGFAFNLKGGLADSSGNVPDSTNDGGAVATSNGYSFNGVDQYIQTYLDGVDLPINASISAMSTPYGDTTYQGLLATRTQSGVEFGIFFGYTNAEQVVYRTASFGNKTGTSNRTTRTLSHGVSNATSNKVYADGILEGTSTGTQSAQIANTVNHIGNLASRNGDWFNGEIEWIHYRQVESTADYVESEYNNQSSPVDFWESSAWERQGSSPGSSADVDFTIDSPVFSAEGSATLPNPNADIDFTIDSPAFSVTGSATVPYPQADIDFTIDSPTFSVAGSATLPNPQADIDFTIDSPTFSVTGSATLPYPQADIDFTIDSPVFSVEGSVTLPYPQADVDFTINSPVFSATGSVTLPDPEADIDFTIDGPVFSIFGTVSGLEIPLGSILIPTFGSNVITLPYTSNIIKL